MKYLEEFKLAYSIRKTEEYFLEIFKLGKISGTVHTCVGQEFSGVFAAKHSIKGDYVVSNHRGHGHYLSFTKDYKGLVGELLGNNNGSSKGIGGSQHLYNDFFYSNGIQGGMLPIAAGLAFANKLEKNNNISIAFLGDGTLGEGILYETLNISSLWDIPIVFILEKNNISQSTSTEQNFSGDLQQRICGFGVNYYQASIYDIENLDIIFEEAFNFSRNKSKPVFIEIELARLNSHSKGDDNRDNEYINKIQEVDPLNIFCKINSEMVSSWNIEIQDLLKKIELDLSEINYDIPNIFNLIKNHEQKSEKYLSLSTQNHDDVRYNELIYNELNKILKNQKNSILIGEDIENNNKYNPKEYGGAFKVTRDLSNLFPNQVKNTPISEQAITGIAIGSALKGNVSILEIMFGDFITLSFDQLLQHVSKFTCMYGFEMKIPFILRTPMGGFRGYGPTHSQSIEKHLLGIPGLKIIALNQFLHPSIIFNKILNDKNPVILIENKILYTKKMYENQNSGYTTEISDDDTYPILKISPIYHEPNITIVCYGGILDEILKASESLFIEEEILLNIFVISDLTNSFIPGLSTSLSQTRKLCIIEEGNSYAAFSSEVVTNLHEYNCTDFKLKRISNNTIIPSSRELENKVLPTSLIIKNSIKDFNYE